MKGGNEVLEDAKKKLQSEMDSSQNNSYVQVVGQFLLDYLQTHPEDSKKILEENKTIAKSLDAMRKEAEKKKVGNCAVLTGQEVFPIILKYFGIDATPETPTIITTPTQPSTNLDIDLEDLF